MTKLHLETIIPLKREEYWAFCYSNDYDAFQAKFIQLKHVEELESYEKDSVVYRRVKVIPDVELPSSILWYLGQEQFHYHDIQEKDLKNFIVRFHTVPPMMEDRFDIRGEARLEAIDEKSCRLVMDLNIEISAWGLGGVFETLMAKNLETSTSNMGKAVEAWINRNNPEYQAKLALEEKSQQATTPQPQQQQPQQQQTGIASYLSSWWS